MEVLDDTFDDAVDSFVESTIRFTTKAEEITDDEANSSSFKPAEQAHTRRERIINKRPVFKWLPVLCSNDIVHGSWWFVWGSLLAMFVGVIPLADAYSNFFSNEDDTLPALEFKETWALMIISGFFFTLGSAAFVRAFEEPEKHPLFKWKHFASDELLGAWLFLFGTIPFVPYALIFWFLQPDEIVYLGAVVVTGVMVLATYLFVLACYPSDKKHKQMIKPLARKIFGARHWVIKHLQNDWLAGMWFFLYGSILSVIGSIWLLGEAIFWGNALERFVYACSLVDMIVFVVGCLYFVAGSYPSDHMKCYKSTTLKDKQSLIAAQDTYDETPTNDL